MTGASDAADAGLIYVSDHDSGLTRRRAGRGFTYRDRDGKPVRDAATIDRIRAIAIPPAWTDVWISPTPRGHIQATGRDARGRKQYRYHPRFRRARDADKFGRLVSLGERLPRLRRRVDADLRRPGLPREKVLAAVIRLMELTLLRVGNEEYARLNRSFGLSTLHNRHARVRGSEIRFRFPGKGGRLNEVDVTDRRLAAVVRRCQDLPGQALFEYVGSGPEPEPIDSSDVNAYLREALGDDDFSAKDLRTWAGTMLAFQALRSDELPPTSATDARRRVVQAVRETAADLGNTPAVARASYVDPRVLETFLEGGMEARPRAGVASGRRPSRAAELALLRVLRKRKGSRPGPVRIERPRRASSRRRECH